MANRLANAFVQSLIGATYFQFSCGRGRPIVDCSIVVFGMSGTYKTVTEWENYLSTLNGPMGKKKRAALLNFVRFGSDGGSEGVGGGKAQAQAVRTPCGPAVSQAVGASYTLAPTFQR